MALTTPAAPRPSTPAPRAAHFEAWLNTHQHELKPPQPYKAWRYLAPLARPKVVPAHILVLLLKHKTRVRTLCGTPSLYGCWGIGAAGTRNAKSGSPWNGLMVKLMGTLMYRLLATLLDRLLAGLLDRLLAGLLDELLARLMDQLMAELLDRLLAGLLDRLFGRTFGRTSGRTYGQTSGHTL